MVILFYFCTKPYGNLFILVQKAYGHFK